MKKRETMTKSFGKIFQKGHRKKIPWKWDQVWSKVLWKIFQVMTKKKDQAFSSLQKDAEK